jgi:hypothetical protein
VSEDASVRVLGSAVFGDIRLTAFATSHSDQSAFSMSPRDGRASADVHISAEVAALVTHSISGNLTG